MKLAGRSAIVTGGASGLGLAAARRLVADGAAVVVADPAEDAGRKAAQELGAAARYVPTDVTDEAQVQAAVDAAGDLGNLSVVVNCAGISFTHRVVGKSGPFPLKDFRRLVDINLTGTFNVTRLAAAAMVATPDAEEERGVVVMTSSAAAFDGQVGQMAYSASKGGIVGMTLPLARDLAQHRIRVMTIAPGLFMTPLFESLGEKVITSLGEQTPHPQRLGDPAEFAAMVAHIIENPMLNGETIRLDGAIRMAPR